MRGGLCYDDLTRKSLPHQHVLVATAHGQTSTEHKQTHKMFFRRFPFPAVISLCPTVAGYLTESVFCTFIWIVKLDWDVFMWHLEAKEVVNRWQTPYSLKDAKTCVLLSRGIWQGEVLSCIHLRATSKSLCTHTCGVFCWCLITFVQCALMHRCVYVWPRHSGINHRSWTGRCCRCRLHLSLSAWVRYFTLMTGWMEGGEGEKVSGGRVV